MTHHAGRSPQCLFQVALDYRLASQSRVRVMVRVRVGDAHDDDDDDDDSESRRFLPARVFVLDDLPLSASSS